MKVKFYNRVLFLFCLISFAQGVIFAQTPLVGAYYFDGWAGSKNVQNEEWAINAPSHLTKKLAIDYIDRKPLWGWRDDKLSIMEEQIELASNNGIDFFSFCWYWKDDNKSIDTVKIANHSLHTSINLFMQAENKQKMKFSLLIANHSGARIKTENDWKDAVNYWTTHYFNDPQYLKIDGKPVITIFASTDVNKYIPAIREYVKAHTPYEDLFIISNCYAKSDSHYDMFSWYNIREAEPDYSEERDYSQLMKKVRTAWNNVDSSHSLAPCVMVNWDRRPWETTSQGLYYTGRTPKLFRTQIEEALQLACQRNERHRLIFIYAWNELGEGGYLVPTLGDKKGTYLKQVKRAKNKFTADKILKIFTTISKSVGK